MGMAGEGDGFYLRPEDQQTLQVTLPGGNVQSFVPVQRFMEVQKERDDWRRAVSMIHGHLLEPDPEVRLRAIWRVCESVGLTMNDAKAMHGLIAWARSGSKT